jgi:hypothetical protein
LSHRVDQNAYVDCPNQASNVKTIQFGTSQILN